MWSEEIEFMKQFEPGSSDACRLLDTFGILINEKDGGRKPKGSSYVSEVVSGSKKMFP
jgi:hypothetical protein